MAQRRAASRALRICCRRRLGENFLARPSWPFPYDSFPLARSKHELTETIDGSIQREKHLKYGAEGVSTGSDKLVLVDLKLDACSTREADTLVREQAREMRLALDGDYAFDLAIAGQIFGEVVDFQNL